MIKLVKQNGEGSYGINKYLIDTIEDLKSFPDYINMGCEAILASKNEIYIKNGKGQWVLKKSIGSGSGDNNNFNPISEADLEIIIKEIFNEGDEN